MQTNGHEQNGTNVDRSGGYKGWEDLAEVDEMPADPSAPNDAPNNRERAQTRGYRPAYQEATRKPAAERDSAFNALAWLLEGATGMVEELRHSDLGLSEDFWVHAAAARREGLLAARAVLDQLLEETEQQQTAERRRQERQSRRGGINVDF